jgi:sulfur-carrier protein
MSERVCTVKLFGGLREKAGQAEFVMEIGTAGEILDRLVQGNEALREAIFAGRELRPHVRVMLKGLDIELAQGLETAVGENEQLAVFPPLAGG